MTMWKLRTVRIKDPGFEAGVLINESDYDPAVHVLFGAPGEPDAAALAAWRAQRRGPGARGYALPTVRIHDAGFPSGVLINESDYDPEADVLFDPPA